MLALKIAIFLIVVLALYLFLYFRFWHKGEKTTAKTKTAGNSELQIDILAAIKALNETPEGREKLQKLGASEATMLSAKGDLHEWLRTLVAAFNAKNTVETKCRVETEKKPDEMKKKIASGIFQAGIFLAANALIVLLSGENFWKFLGNHPIFILFFFVGILPVAYSYASGKTNLHVSNVIMWVILAVSLLYMFAHRPGKGFAETREMTTAYIPPSGYETGEKTFSMEAGERKVVNFRPGKESNWSVDTKPERTGNDSLMIISEAGDTLKTWLPDQHLSGKYSSLTLVARDKMRDIKFTTW